jgi:hypothetical protein
MDDPQPLCDGCTGCALRCTDGIRISEFEYTRILDVLRAGDPIYAHRVLAQDKWRVWSDEVRVQACLFLDLTTERCLVYAARPLVCRLFGHVPHLPCPLERLPATRDADRVLDAYTRQPLRTMQEWMAIDGLFDFDALLGVPYTPDRLEV